MKDRLLQLLLKGHTVQDAIAFWELFRRGRFHALLLEPTANTVTQLFRYVITGASSFLLDFLLLFILETAGMHYLPAAACSFTAGTVCNFLLT
ncbi:MAG TPA: GtrA family protein, partial [Candidatus Evtepia faecavium]|nr:GtrA family protein [Candidatus Evtepia faecavium]